MRWILCNPKNRSSPGIAGESFELGGHGRPNKTTGGTMEVPKNQMPLIPSGAPGSQAEANADARAWDEQITSVTPLSKIALRSKAELESEELLDLFGKPRPVPLKEEFLPPVVEEYLSLTKPCTDAKPGMLVTAWLPFAAVNLGNRVYMLNKYKPEHSDEIR